MEYINLTITSFNNIQLTRQIDMVIVPGILGHMSLKYGDRTCITLLNPGMIYIFDQNKLEDSFFVFGGNVIATKEGIFIHTTLDIIDIKLITTAEIKAIVYQLENDMINLKSQQSAHDITYYLRNKRNTEEYLILNASIKYYEKKIKTYNLLLSLIKNLEYN